MRRVAAAAFLLLFAAELFAAEVVNLKVTTTPAALLLEYDLQPARNEKEAGISVTVDIEGKVLTPASLSLEGDFGRKVAVGASKKIIWRYIEDFPEGIKSAFKCNVEAVSSAEAINEWDSPSVVVREGRFAVSRQAVTDRKSRIMWMRNASVSPKPLNMADAVRIVEEINARKFAGYSDWRIPSRKELEGLASVAKEGGWGKGFSRFISDYMIKSGFNNVQSGLYWTSTPAPAEKTYFAVSTWNGSVNPLSDSNFYHLLPVRSIPK